MNEGHPTSNTNACEVCGAPAVQWVLSDPFGKSDTRRPLCIDHGMRLRDQEDIAEIERLRGRLDLIGRLSAHQPVVLAIQIAREALNGDGGAHETAPDPALSEALKLANDVGGAFSAFEQAVRSAIGNTNYTVIMDRVRRLIDSKCTCKPVETNIPSMRHFRVTDEACPLHGFGLKAEAGHSNPAYKPCPACVAIGADCPHGESAQNGNGVA